MAKTHEELCERARRWLAGSRQCAPVLSNIASCAEIPDAIGWSSCWKHQGSTVVECKCSIADFYADKKKYIAWKHPRFDSQYPGTRITQKEADAEGYTRIDLTAMGDYRFFMCESGIISESQVSEMRPDHGLLYVRGRRIEVAREAPQRTLVDKDGEIRYLRFAIINNKMPWFDSDSSAQFPLGTSTDLCGEEPTTDSSRSGEPVATKDFSEG